jgi:hypothetical protein
MRSIRDARTGATYAVDGGAFTITFSNGRTYSYDGVPVAVVIGFVSARSQAQFSRTIKGKY